MKEVSIGEINLINQKIHYINNPTNLFHQIGLNRPHTLLFESAETQSKKEIQSLMLIDAAVQITCKEQTVEFKALTQNGINCINAIKQAFTKTNHKLNERQNKLMITFPKPKYDAMEEEEKFHSPSVLDALRLTQKSFKNLKQHPKQALFIAGIFSYDLVSSFETLPELDQVKPCPDYVFYISEILLIINHKQKTSHLQATVFGAKNHAKIHSKLTKRIGELASQKYTKIKPLPNSDTQNLDVFTSLSDQQFANQVRSLKNYIKKGDIYQVVPSRKFKIECTNPLSAYCELKRTNPSPYMFYFQHESFTLFGASPESALKYDAKTNQVEIYPIAGTRPRGKQPNGTLNQELDTRIELELRQDQKEQAEHIMLVDLARNDIARISKTGTRKLAELLQIDRYSHVMHLVSRITGQLRKELDALHAYQACMNMGTLTGAPKIRAMELIRQYENEYRGTYGGAIGYLNGHGDLDSCIIIRSAYVKDKYAHIQTGAGIVADSIPEKEALETIQKAQSVLSAIQSSQTPIRRNT